jgi:hypothetical protein
MGPALKAWELQVRALLMLFALLLLLLCTCSCFAPIPALLCFAPVIPTPTCAITVLKGWSDCKIRWEGGREEGGRVKVGKFFGVEKRWEKINNFEQGGCVFRSS